MTDATATTEDISFVRRLQLVNEGIQKFVAQTVTIPYLATDGLNFASEKLFDTKVYSGPTHDQATQIAIDWMDAGDRALGIHQEKAKNEAEQQVVDNTAMAANVALVAVPGLGQANMAKTAMTAANAAKTATAGSAFSAAATGAGYAWTGTKAAAHIVGAPLLHTKTFVVGTGLGHVVTDGWTSNKIWDFYIGGWNLGKEYAPGVAATAAEGLLKVGDGTMGFLATGAKRGASGLADYVPPGVSTFLKTGLNAVSGNAEAATGNPETDSPAPAASSSLRERTLDVATNISDKAKDVVDDIDFMDTPEAGPFRDRIASHLNIDPAKVNGKLITEKMTQLAKDNPYFGMGMAFGTLYGAMGSDKSVAGRAMGAAIYGVVFGIAFQFLGQLYPGLAPALMKMLNAAPDVLPKVPAAIGLNTSSLNGGFKAAAEGTAPAPTSAPAQDQPRTPVANKFDQAANGEPVLSPAPTPEDVDLRRNRPEAANNASYRLSVGAPS